MVATPPPYGVILKPCAHCGHDESVYQNFGSDGHMVSCSLCFISTTFWDTPAKAFENWNRRVKDGGL